MRKRLGATLGGGAMLAAGLVSVALATEWQQTKTVTCPGTGASTVVAFNAQIPHSTPAKDYRAFFLKPGTDSFIYPICPGTTQTSVVTRIPGTHGLDTIRDKVTIQGPSAGPAPTGGHTAATPHVEFRVLAGNADIRIQKFLTYNGHAYKPNSTAKVVEGDNLKFEIYVLNFGPDAANGVVVNEVLPEGFKVTSSTIPGGGATISKEPGGVLRVAAKGFLRDHRRIKVVIEGKFDKVEGSAENLAELDPGLFNSYQEPNRKPDSAFINLHVVK